MTPEALPPHARYATLVAIGLGVMVSLGSCQDFDLALKADTFTVPDFELSGLDQLSPDGKLLKEGRRAAMQAQLYAIETMGWGRVLLASLLSIAAMTVGVWGFRVRWPGGARRVLALQVASFAALISAVLSAMDGGQELVISTRGAEAMAQVLGPANAALPDLNYLGFVVTAASSVKALVIVGGFLIVWKVFSSAPVLEAARRLDELSGHDDE